MSSLFICHNPMIVVPVVAWERGALAAQATLHDMDFRAANYALAGGVAPQTNSAAFETSQLATIYSVHDLNFAGGAYGLASGVAPQTNSVTFETSFLAANYTVHDLAFTSGTYGLASGIAPQTNSATFEASYLAANASIHDLNFSGAAYSLAIGVAPQTSKSAWQLTALFAGTNDLNFASATYGVSGTMTALTSIVGVTRSGFALVPDASGNYTSVAANTARVSTAGLLVEAAATNALPNNSYTDATYGAVATNGTELIGNGWLTANITGWTDHSTGTGTTAFANPGLSLAGGISGNAISETSFAVLAGTIYTVQFSNEGAAVTVQIGSTSGGTDIQAATSVSVGGCRYQKYTAAANGTWYLRFSNSANTTVTVYSVSAQAFAFPSNLYGTSFGGLPMSPATRTITTVAAAGTINGLPSMNLRAQRASGVNAASAPVSLLYLCPFTAIAASNGQTWSVAASMALSAGTLGAVTSVLLGFSTATSGSSTLAFHAGSVALTSALQRFAYSTTIADGATVAQLHPYLELSLAQTGAIDCTVTMAGSQVENTLGASSPILTTNAAASRAADVVYEYLNGTAAGAVVIWATTGPANKISTLWTWDDGSTANALLVQWDASGNLRCIVTVGGTQQANLNLGAVAANTSFKLAFSWAANAFAAVLNGGAAVTTSSGSVPSGLVRILYGSDSTGDYWNSFIAHHTTFNAVLSQGTMGLLTT